MYKNLIAALAASVFFSPAFSETKNPEPLKIGFVPGVPMSRGRWANA
jgi:hypothetical protein